MNIMERFNEANNYLVNEDTKMAQGIFEELYTETKDDKALMGLAFCAYQKQAYNEALNILTKIQKNNINHAGSYNLSGMIGAQLSEWERARDMFAIAIELDPSFVEAQRNYGHSLIEIGEYEEGIHVFLKILEKYPNDIESLVSMASFNEEAKRYKDALLYSQKILELDPDNELIHDLVGRIDAEVNNL